MGTKRTSKLGILGRGLMADVLLFVVAIALMSVFALSSFSTAYLGALALLITSVTAVILYKRTKKSG